MGYELVGEVWDNLGFEAYLADVNLGWANSVTVHHTAAPSLKQRPQGWIIQHMRNLEHYYKTVLRWSAAPHLFTDEDQIFGMSSLYKRGVHARSFNRDSIGIECLGNYDVEDPETGRGLKCWHTTAETVATILRKMNLPVNETTVLFHRDDPKTNKTCPGKLVTKQWFISLVNSYYAETPVTPVPTLPDPVRLLTDRQKLEAIKTILG